MNCKGTTSAVLMLGTKCNASCSYCFEMERKSDPFYMDYNYVSSHILDKFHTIHVHGGEAYLYRDEIKNWFDNLKNDHVVAITLNGKELDKDFIDWCVDNNFKLCFSYDGRKHRELRGYDGILEKYPDLYLSIPKDRRSLMCCFNRENCDIDDFLAPVHEFEEKYALTEPEVTGLGIIKTCGCQALKDRFYFLKKDQHIWQSKFDKLFKMLEDEISGKDICDTNVFNELTKQCVFDTFRVYLKILVDWKKGIFSRRSYCSTDLLCVGLDGRVFGCTNFNRLEHRKIKSECQTCHYNFLCGGRCNWNPLDTDECNLWIYIFDNLLRICNMEIDNGI